ncbi:tubulin binding cofactor A [Acaromyces ingoldii]|uniref:Tubulin-specific chaperone A n=1 Tax=Acaromyces ingoldii TaxID=215250 RepID=A0A316YLR3_9BASI|nr:tubulin binding cofactor A [Acaromyces ingoldii]PWN90189.1 tubulin binding cofactor A [Acaromyces ingoldii]
MSDEKSTKRQLTIKTGVVKRLVKEEKSYVKEAQEQEARVAKTEADGKEEWEVKKQKEVLQDCLQMIPDCKKRLEAAVADLQNILEGLEGDIAESDEAKAARDAIESSKAQ